MKRSLIFFLESSTYTSLWKMELMRVNNTLKAELRKFHLLDNFQFRFNQVHADFFVNLRSKHKTLTNSEMKYCAFLKIKLSTHQISGLLNIGKDAIKKKRYRMRKKRVSAKTLRWKFTWISFNFLQLQLT